MAQRERGGSRSTSAGTPAQRERSNDILSTPASCMHERIHLPRPFPKRRETGGNGEHADLWLKMGESRSSAEARARMTGRETGCRRNAEDGAGRSQQGRPSLRHRRLPTSPKPRWPVGVCSLVRCKSSACCGVDSCVSKQTSLACQALRKVALLDSDELRFGAQTLFLRNLPPLEQEVPLLTVAQDIRRPKGEEQVKLATGRGHPQKFTTRMFADLLVLEQRHIFARLPCPSSRDVFENNQSIDPLLHPRVWLCSIGPVWADYQVDLFFRLMLKDRSA